MQIIKRKTTKNSNKTENSPKKQATKETPAKYNKTAAFCITKLIKVKPNKANIIFFNFLSTHVKGNS
jgi:hypothetical protein